MEDSITLIIADDKIRYRTVIKELLAPYRVSVTGEAANGKELLSLLLKGLPDIILLDLDMPVMDGNQTFDIIRKTYPETKVIILSYYSESVLIEDYLERGAKGFIPKETLEPGMLMNVLKQVKNGSTFIPDKSITKRNFTARQKEILPLIFEGLTNEEIAGEVFISKRAVEKQRFKIYQKTGVKRVIDFYKYAFTKGLQFLGKRKAIRRSKVESYLSDSFKHSW